MLVHMYMNHAKYIKCLSCSENPLATFPFLDFRDFQAPFLPNRAVLPTTEKFLAGLVIILDHLS